MAEHHRARRLALQGLCCLDVQGEKGLDGAVAFIRDSRESPQTLDAAEAILRQAFADRDRIDLEINRQSRHWHSDRMALVDRNILRLAVWELLAGETPTAVVIDEAVRLAKEFSAGESPRFVNGVLDAVARKLKAREKGGGDAAVK